MHLAHSHPLGTTWGSRIPWRIFCSGVSGANIPPPESPLLDTPLYHINLLKQWIEALSNPALATSALVPSIPFGVQPLFKEDLHPIQCQDLEELCNQNSNLFSKIPGWTHMLQHDIKTPPGVTGGVQSYQGRCGLDAPGRHPTIPGPAQLSQFTSPTEA